jgi:ribosomal protein L32
MPNPKRRFSKTRTATRRNAVKLSPRPFYIDAESGEPTPLHHVNTTSGYYRGKQVIEGSGD